MPAPSILFRRRRPNSVVASLVPEGDPCISIVGGKVTVSFGDDRETVDFIDMRDAARVVAEDVVVSERDVHFSGSCENPGAHGMPAFSREAFEEQVREIAGNLGNSPSP